MERDNGFIITKNSIVIIRDTLNGKTEIYSIFRWSDSA